MQPQSQSLVQKGLPCFVKPNTVDKKSCMTSYTKTLEIMVVEYILGHAGLVVIDRITLTHTALTCRALIKLCLVPTWVVWCMGGGSIGLDIIAVI